MAPRGSLLLLALLLLASAVPRCPGQHWSHGWYPGGKRDLAPPPGPAGKGPSSPPPNYTPPRPPPTTIPPPELPPLRFPPPPRITLPQILISGLSPPSD
uniref:Progonadoliberin n=1 Tax=Aquila chrysaetos chrysaetos TaxID=223781 RepID=A0A663DJN8_AQUCH